MKKSIFIFLVTLFISCDIPNRHLKRLTIKTKIDIIVNRIELSNGIIINNEYAINFPYFIIENNKIPNWIYKKEKMSEVPYIDNFGETYSVFYKILPPYQMIKSKNSNILKVIKDQDTLNFLMDE